jgi:3',5'-cyclic AMP phosphodiesterase CpdA
LSLRAVLALIIAGTIGAACAGDAGKPNAVPIVDLQLPELSDGDFRHIASQIYLNETGGRSRYLTYWGAGEDFPSFGIGHFIWFPAGVDAPFDESFPTMFEFVVGQGVGIAPPEWIAELGSMDAPWPNKPTFDAALTAVKLVELRDWLSNTRSQQARYIAYSFAARWRRLELANTRKDPLTALLNDIMRTPDGLFAILDYYNFKGLGENPRERYDGSGWGLVQVLDGIVRSGCAAAADVPVLKCFSRSAGSRLRERVIASPRARNEERWLAGWLRRVDDYIPPRDGFVLTPFLQNPQQDSMTIVWFSKRMASGRLELMTEEAGSSGDLQHVTSRAVAAPSLYYHTYEFESFGRDKPRAALYRHEVTLSGLQPGQSYQYSVQQGVEDAGGQFQMRLGSDPVRFIVYGDSETEPESTGKHTLWPSYDGGAPQRRYSVDQTTGYAANLAAIANRKPDFVAIAGDLVESGGEQRDWDEFWRHNAQLAANTPIFPALGNHEYYGGPKTLGGYSDAASRRAIAKYRTYFALPDADGANGSSQKHYYATSHGPLTLIVLDTNNGMLHHSANDTNWRSQAATAWNDESGQLAWLRRQLARAQRESAFTFVMFHQAPYSSGVHNQPPGEAEGQDYLSGVPLRELTPLFLRYGVDAVFNGHDEVYEHSVIRGAEQTVDGADRPHELHYLVVGIGGDGLRGSFAGVSNAHKVFSAHADAAEVYDKAGNLLAGGKHYGHLEVNIERDASGCWQARIEPVHVFPVTGSATESPRFERRVYDDVTTVRQCEPMAAAQ